MAKTIEVSDETFEKIKDQLIKDDPVGLPESLADLVGQKWFIRTVTYHCVGKAVKLVNNFLFLTDASWVADSGRFQQAIQTGSLSETEPVGLMAVNLEAVVDLFPWMHDLPTK